MMQKKRNQPLLYIEITEFFCSVIKTTFAAHLHNRKQNNIIAHKEHSNKECIYIRMNVELMS